MHYLVLLHDVERAELAPGTPEWDADMAAFDRFAELAGEAIVGGEALQPSDTGVVLRPDVGTVVDGPFAETAEVVGGYFVLEAPDLDAVLELATAIPTARTGALEVRPIAGDWQPPLDAPAGTSRYLALLHGVPTEADVKGSPAWEAAIEQHRRFGEEHGEHILGGAELHVSDTATTVRVRDDVPQLADGPFTETAEVVGGFYLLAAATRDEAVAVASGIPMSDGAIELRPVLELDE